MKFANQFEFRGAGKECFYMLTSVPSEHNMRFPKFGCVGEEGVGGVTKKTVIDEGCKRDRPLNVTSESSFLQTLLSLSLRPV